MFRAKNKELMPEQQEIVSTKDFFDRAIPGSVRFFSDHYICGNYYKSCWAITEYPPTTEDTAILAHLADRSGVTLRIYNRLSVLPGKHLTDRVYGRSAACGIGVSPDPVR